MMPFKVLRSLITSKPAGSDKATTMVVTVSKRTDLAPPQHKPAGPCAMPATMVECEELDERLCRDAIRLECQLGIVKGKSHSEGEFADPTWYHKANAALKHLRRDRQRLVAHMKQLRIDARRADVHWSSRDQRLIRALRDELPPGRFDEIVEDVETEIEIEVGALQ